MFSDVPQDKQRFLGTPSEEAVVFLFFVFILTLNLERLKLTTPPQAVGVLKEFNKAYHGGD
jgi:hypothetical protein